MGYSSIAFSVALAIVVVTVGYSLSQTTGDYQRSMSELKEYGARSGDNKRASIAFLDFNVVSGSVRGDVSNLRHACTLLELKAAKYKGVDPERSTPCSIPPDPC